MTIYYYYKWFEQKCSRNCFKILQTFLFKRLICKAGCRWLDKVKRWDLASRYQFEQLVKIRIGSHTDSGQNYGRCPYIKLHVLCAGWRIDGCRDVYHVPGTTPLDPCSSAGLHVPGHNHSGGLAGKGGVGSLGPRVESSRRAAAVRQAERRQACGPFPPRVFLGLRPSHCVAGGSCCGPAGSCN